MSETLAAECLNLVRVPHAALFAVAMDVADHPTNIAEAVRVGRRMIEVMLANDGIGLAANQVGLPIRVIVAYVPAVMPRPAIYINPAEFCFGEREDGVEACLSDPGASVVVRRFTAMTMSYTDEGGLARRRTFKGKLARVLQHEIDHLNGINIRATKDGGGA